MTPWLLALTALAGPPAPAPSTQTVVYYNARMALREGDPTEAVKLWLLRNAVEVQSGVVSPHDADFRSVTWAALGALGVCQDGLPKDSDGAGLWPLGLYNWLVENQGRRPSARPNPFAAFQLGRQARRLSIGDVPGAQELRTVQLSPGPCLRPRALLIGLGEKPTRRLDDLEANTRLLAYLLDVAVGEVRPDRTEGWAAVIARRFDLHLQLMAIAEREAIAEAREAARTGRTIGLAAPSLAVMAADAPATRLPPDSEAARILVASASWPASEWMSLSPDRRLFLFDQARAYGVDGGALDAVALGVIDHLIADHDGTQIGAWIARVGSVDDPASQARVWSGDRGLGLLGLDATSGFRDRGVIALHRGVDQLERGDLRGALQSLAVALTWAPESSAADTTQQLARRWLSFALAQYESSSELLATLRELAPARDYAAILEDLMWRAALRGDSASFERGVAPGSSRTGSVGALDRRLAAVRPLASGDVAGFLAGVSAGLSANPSETLRLVDQLVVRLQLEDPDVRARHTTTLSRVAALLQPLAVEDGGSSGRQARSAAALLDRIDAVLAGLPDVAGPSTERERARAIDPAAAVFAGSLRVAPVDALPWPFRAVATRAPPVFTPFALTPREWLSPDDEWVFGWSISG